MSGVRDINTLASIIANRLKTIYPENFSESLVNRILSLLAPNSSPGPLWDERDVVLITYGDSLTSPKEKPLVTLRRFLESRLSQTIGCVHILPFFPSTSDDGFAVSDYISVAPELGDWEDIAAIGKEFSLMFDLVLNHVSASHPWFMNFREGKSPGKDYFIEMDPGADYLRVVRPRNTPLFTAYITSGGIKKLWTTFSADQIDLNFGNPEVLIEMIRIFLFYISHGARIIRLDAVAFLWKEKDSSCIHLPGTHEVIKLLRDIAAYVGPRIIILTETNVPNRENWSYFGQLDEAHMVYQFTLPPLILYTLYTGNARYLTEWAVSIPAVTVGRTFLNFTASHDGIGIRPLEGILPESEIHLLISSIRDFGGLISVKSNPDGTSSPYEMNITYLDALKGTRNGPDNLMERRFLCSQLIVLAMQGIPAIYIQSLLGTANDYEEMKKTGQARSINRKKWNEATLLQLLSDETSNKLIFTEYTRAIAIRRQIRAFHPDCPQQIVRLGDPVFAFVRTSPQTGEEVFCISNITNRIVVLPKTGIPLRKGITDLLTGEEVAISGEFTFGPYQTRWLRY
jgi:sucrose phosphorylase